MFAFKRYFQTAVRSFTNTVYACIQLSPNQLDRLQKSFAAIRLEDGPALIEVLYAGQDCKEYGNVHRDDSW